MHQERLAHIIMLQAYRVSIEAAGVDARPAWADLVKQDREHLAFQDTAMGRLHMQL